MVQTRKMTITRSDGAVFELGRDWVITDWSGLETPDATVYTEDNALGDGSIITAQRANVRVISVSANLRATAMLDATAMRRAAVAFFVPKMMYTLSITFRGVTRKIEGALDGFECPAGQRLFAPTIQAEFICPQPWLSDNAPRRVEVSKVVGMWGFPYLMPIGGKPVSAYGFAQRTAVITNGGDVAVGIRATITTRGIDVVNPQIILGGDVQTELTKSITVLTTISEGDELVIDTVAKTVTLNGANALMLVERTSNFTDFVLSVGQNIIGYNAESGSQDMNAVIEYSLEYSGM